MSNAGTVIKQLPKAWKVGGQEAKDVELRPPTLEDLLEAEMEAHPGQRPNAFNVAMACRTIVRAGKFTGPFVGAHFKGMSPGTWYAIRDAIVEAEELGEGEQPSQAQPS